MDEHFTTPLNHVPSIGCNLSKLGSDFEVAIGCYCIGPQVVIVDYRDSLAERIDQCYVASENFKRPGRRRKGAFEIAN